MRILESALAFTLNALLFLFVSEVLFSDALQGDQVFLGAWLYGTVMGYLWRTND